ncbi:hypothetical protein TNCV_4911621 [Trichonephila clavipes]|nr:hypothetical protein TNCV_4911621 [Trichonephila clavipes]
MPWCGCRENGDYGIKCHRCHLITGQNSIKGKNVVEAKETCGVFGEEVKFCLSGFSLKDEPRSGGSSDVSDEVLRRTIRTNPTLTSTEVDFKFGIHQTTALDCRLMNSKWLL